MGPPALRCRSLVSISSDASLLAAFASAPSSIAMPHSPPLATHSSSKLSALSSAGSLASLSLRGVATDEMLHSLAAAVGTNLRLADCAFSKDITDAGVNALVQGAPRLQRMNLRGCDSISAECYNITPITLLERSRAQSADGASGAAAAPAAAAEAASPAKMRRKGDNMFWFGRQ